jgi:alkylation response protein AidB-like acyl-CoA dehydrogenase
VYFALSPEQQDLRESLAKFFAEVSPLSRVRSHMSQPSGYDLQTWTAMQSQLGLQGMLIPEEFGGAGAEQMELVLVFEELGASLACVPYFSTVGLAVNLLLVCDDEAAKREYLPRIAQSATVATVAYAEGPAGWAPAEVRLAATETSSGWTLSGAKEHVIDGADAELIFVVARTPAGLGLFAVDGDAPGLHRTPQPTLDQTRKQARLHFAQTPARLVGADGSAEKPMAAMFSLAAVALSAEQVGGARRCLDMAVAYAKSRHQFGRAIGSFQAIKHKCANVLMELESAQAAVHYAGWAATEHPEDRAMHASLVKAYASDTYVLAASENMQIHGGMGFMWECDAHLYLKRARTSALLLGTPDYHREQLATCIGL